MPAERLTPEQEKEAELLAERIHNAAGDEFLKMARLLVGKKAGEIFGATEFQVRDMLLKVGMAATSPKQTMFSSPLKNQKKIRCVPVENTFDFFLLIGGPRRHGDARVEETHVGGPEAGESFPL